jgi:hypothetical protein
LNHKKNHDPKISMWILRNPFYFPSDEGDPGANGRWTTGASAPSMPSAPPWNNSPPGGTNVYVDGPAKSDKPPILDGWKPINDGIHHLSTGAGFRWIPKPFTVGCGKMSSECMMHISCENITSSLIIHVYFIYIYNILK